MSRDVVMGFLGGVREGDVDAARAAATDDVVWRIPGRSSIGGETQGAEAISAKFRALVDAGLRPEVLGVLDGEDRVAFVQRNRAEVGEHRLDVDVVNVFTLADGRVRRMDTYFGDQAALDAFWDAVLPDGA